jgi:hypothetical protein
MGLPPLHGDAHNLADKIGRTNVVVRPVARRPAMDNATAGFAADHSDASGFWMGAALAAPRDVHGDVVIARRKMSGYFGSERARRDEPGGAGREAWAGDDTPARIGGIDNESELLGCCLKRIGFVFCKRAEQQSTAGRGANCPGGANRSRVSELRQRFRIHLPEGGRDPERDAFAPKRMFADSRTGLARGQKERSFG